MKRIVIDTNVFISALRSNRGASFRLLSLVGTERFDFCLSVPLILEFEAVAKREPGIFGLAPSEIDDILDYPCAAVRTGRHEKHALCFLRRRWVLIVSRNCREAVWFVRMAGGWKVLSMRKQ